MCEHDRKQPLGITNFKSKIWSDVFMILPSQNSGQNPDRCHVQALRSTMTSHIIVRVLNKYKWWFKA